MLWGVMMGTRKGNNEGCIYKDKQGRWRGVISLPSSDGKYKRKYIYGKTRKEVSEKISEILNQLHTNTYVEPCKITLYSWLCTWIDTYCKNEVRMSTYVNYDIYIQKHIKDNIGGYRLCDLNTVIIQQFYNEKSKNGRLDGKGGLSPKTMKNMHDMLHRALEKAVQLDMIIKNPSEYTVLPKRKRSEMRFFTVDEQHQLQKSIKGHRLEMAILLCLYTGVRQGELLGLTWENVHLDANGQSYIRIVQAVNRTKNIYAPENEKTGLFISEPKTPHSIRTIPLLSDIAEKLSLYREEQAQYFVENALPQTDFVFTTKTGKLVDPRDFQRDFKLLLKKSNIREINVHGLRHTFATRALESGMSPKTLSKILGHSSVGFTLDTYAHVTDALKVEEMAGLNGFL